MSQSIHDKINFRGSVEKWAEFTIERWQKELTRKKIGQSGALIRSFKKEILFAGGDVRSIYLKFLYYGRFRDMNVGRGLMAYETQINRRNMLAAKRYDSEVDYVNRVPKRWYNKIKTAQTYRLQEILSIQLGHTVLDGLDDLSIKDIKIRM